VPPQTSDVPTGWVAVLAVKHLDAAKSRLALPRPDTTELALAFALDTVTAVLSSRSVTGAVVVTSDPRVRVEMSAAGASVMGEGADGGLNAALALGIRSVEADAPGRGIVLLVADLPALRGSELDAALHSAASVPVGLVADDEGTGSTLLCSGSAALLRPQFGSGSAAAHSADGARRLSSSADRLAGLRRDVDTVAHLAQAVQLGVGPRTRRQLANLGPVPGLDVLSGGPAPMGLPRRTG
jgi:2-phospho-L-lactate guanylyltransferase